MGFFCLVSVVPLCASVYMCFVVTCWERADLLVLVCGLYNCDFVTSPLVAWVRCGTLLYRFLNFAPLLTLYIFSFYSVKTRLFDCMKQTMDRCQGSTEVMALGGYDQESLRKGVDVLCKDVNRKWFQTVFYTFAAPSIELKISLSSSTLSPMSFFP